MLEGDLVFSSVSLAAGMLCLCLGIYVFWKNPYERVSQAFIVSMCLMATETITAFLLVNAPDEGTAVFFARAVLFDGILVSASLLYLSFYLPYYRAESWPIRNKRPFIALAVLLAIIPAALFDDVYLDQNGFWFYFSAPLVMWLAMILVMGLIPVFDLTAICRRSTDKEVRWRSTVVSVGIIIPILFYLGEIVNIRSNANLPHIPAIGLLITGSIFSYAVLGHKLFLVEPVKEENIEAAIGMDFGLTLVSGHCDLIKSKKADLSYRMFVAEIASGNKGLLITRIHPDQVRERYGLVKTPILWLSGQPGPDRVDPASLSILQHIVVDFLQKGPSVILLDGLEYLISENQTDRVLRFIYAVHDAVVISGSKFIVPIDPDVMSQKDLALFEREFDVIEENGPRITD